MDKTAKNFSAKNSREAATDQSDGLTNILGEAMVDGFSRRRTQENIAVPSLPDGLPLVGENDGTADDADADEKDLLALLQSGQRHIYIAGGGGSGKTLKVKKLADFCNRLNKPIAVFTPTAVSSSASMHLTYVDMFRLHPTRLSTESETSESNNEELHSFVD